MGRLRIRLVPITAVPGLIVIVLGVVLGIAGVAAGTLLVSALSGHPASLFIDGRLSDPVGYANATADLWLIAFFPALTLATCHALPTWGRAAAAGSATLLVETALLS